MKYNLVICILVFSLFVSAGVLAASEEEVLKEIFRIETEDLESYFAASFLEQVPLDQVKGIINQYGSALGAVE